MTDPGFDVAVVSVALDYLRDKSPTGRLTVFELHRATIPMPEPFRTPDDAVSEDLAQRAWRHLRAQPTGEPHELIYAGWLRASLLVGLLSPKSGWRRILEMASPCGQPPGPEDAIREHQTRVRAWYREVDWGDRRPWSPTRLWNRIDVQALFEHAVADALDGLARAIVVPDLVPASASWARTQETVRLEIRRRQTTAWVSLSALVEQATAIALPT